MHHETKWHYQLYFYDSSVIMMIVIYTPLKRENNGGNGQVYSSWTLRLKSICSSSQKIPHNSEILSEKALKLINDSIS